MILFYHRSLRSFEGSEKNWIKKFVNLEFFAALSREHSEGVAVNPVLIGLLLNETTPAGAGVVFQLREFLPFIVFGLGHLAVLVIALLHTMQLIIDK